MLRKDLTDRDVRKIVTESIEIISVTQRQLRLPISPNIYRTRKRLENGRFKAKYINATRTRPYAMDFGSFIPPNTIHLDKKLPFSDKPLDMPDFVQTMTTYSAIHEVVHADDHMGGDKLLLATRDHILRSHEDKLEKSLEIINGDGGCTTIIDYEDLASLWAVQYMDMVTHYRGYVVLRHMKYPKLDQIWSRLSNLYFPPNLLTYIEIGKGVEYVFSLFSERIGDYCLIEALDDYTMIKERDANSYTV